MDWNEWIHTQQSWDDFHEIAVDIDHRVHTVMVPLYAKKVVFRIRALEGTEASDYLTTDLIDTLPRSWAQHKPPCIHVPTLNEKTQADIIWGDLYGAQGFVLERQLSGGNFQMIYEGKGQTAPAPDGYCPAMDKVSDADSHFHFVDTIPSGATTARYRVKAYNSTDHSQYLESQILEIKPRSLARELPPCLHIPDMTENQPANIAWGEISDAQWYELDFWLDEPFKEASIGVEWQYLCDAGKRWDDIHPAQSTWTQLHLLPARGLTWQKANLDSLTWNQWNARFNYWTDLGKAPLDFIAFRGNGKAATAINPGTTWGDGHESLGDSGHQSHEILIPYEAKMATYRVRACNATDTTPYINLIPIAPLFHREDSVTVNVTAQETVYVPIIGRELESIAELPITLRYNPAEMKLVNFAAQSGSTVTSPGTVAGTELKVLSHDNGVIQFQFDRGAKAAKARFELITLCEFSALQTRTVVLSLS